MPSIIPGYEYDIFISYRQNDNQDGWVTEFINSLNREIKSTFKEDISIYFDENPHNGLHEHHEVDDSLREKLKCLIFIPIVSQTYCDPKCFAWEHEFKVFVEQASKDQFGLKTKLSDGNVASRVLPVKIHDLESEDQQLFESEVGGVMRSIDFIYKDTGVNRPLAPDDSEEKNLNGTKYKNQVNKVANAIKEIISGIKGGGSTVDENELNISTSTPPLSLETKTKSKNKILLGLLVMLIIIVGSIFYFRYKPPLKTTEPISIAIIPFRNTGTESDTDYGLGMASEIRTKLSMSKQFDFISSLQATLKYSKSNDSPDKIGSELGVNYLLTGLYQLAEEQIQITVELIESGSGNIVWSLPYKTKFADIFDIQSDIASKVLGRFSFDDANDKFEKSTTTNPQALGHYLKGLELSYGGSSIEIFSNTADQFQKAINLDSSYLSAWVGLIDARTNMTWFFKASDTIYSLETAGYMDYIEKHFAESSDKKLAKSIYEYHGYSNYDKGLELALQVLEEDPENAKANYFAGAIYKRKLNFKEAMIHYAKAKDQAPNDVTTWSEIQEVLGYMGDYENQEKAIQMIGDLGDENGANNGMINMAINMGDLRSLPVNLKKELGNEYLFMVSYFDRDYNKCLKILDSAKYLMAGVKISESQRFYRKAEIFHLSGSDDSSRYYSQLYLDYIANKDSVSQISHYIYAFLGELDKALELLKNSEVRNNSNWVPLDDEDILRKVGQKIKAKINIYIITGLYNEATELLTDLNENYPTYGDYNVYRVNPLFDRIKKEYPPFLKALNNLKLPPKLELEKSIRL